MSDQSNDEKRRLGGCPFSSSPSSDQLKEYFGRDVFKDFDYEDPEFNKQMYEVLDTQLEHCPVSRSNKGAGYWWVTRNEDIRKVGQNWKTFTSTKGYQPNRPEGLPFLYPEESDPPRHTAWRNALNPFLSPNACKDYEPQVRQDVNDLIDRFIDRGECEFISEFGSILPGWAFFKNVIGVPVEQLSGLVEGVEKGTFLPGDEKIPHMQGVFATLEAYLKQRAEEPPRGDMVDAILKGVEYEDGRPAPWEHKLSVLVDLTFGGIATTTYVMASALNHLANNPSDRKLLIENPGMMGNALEEFARVFPPIVGLGRTATQDTELNGQQIKEGDFVMMAYSAGSRDPRVVDDPTRIDITRESVLHTTFGVGPHRCIGSNLARVEIATTLSEWLRRIPDFSVKPGTQPIYETGFLRSMRRLELVW